MKLMYPVRGRIKRSSYRLSCFPFYFCLSTPQRFLFFLISLSHAINANNFFVLNHQKKKGRRQRQKRFLQHSFFFFSFYFDSLFSPNCCTLRNARDLNIKSEYWPLISPQKIIFFTFTFNLSISKLKFN
jgi:hypothetical protein